MSVDSSLRLLLYRYFLGTGRAPGNEDLAKELGVELAVVEESLQRLESIHAITLAPATRNVWMVHPFSAVPTPFRVEAGGRRYWPNCAWDALSIPSLLEGDATVDGACADCHEPMTFSFEHGDLARGEGLVHFVVRPTRFWENVGYT